MLRYGLSILRLPLVIVAALLLALAASGGPPASADDFTVTKTDDTADGTCDADCSLREAIIAANAAAGDDIITLPAGTYALTIVGGGENNAASGDLDISFDALTITGAGADTTLIEVDAGADRVFEVVSGSAAISGVTISDGAGDAGFGCACGGAILVRDGTSLTLTDSVISDNSATSTGGGIHNEGTLTLTNSELTNNEGSDGGAIYNLVGGTVEIVNSTVSGNAVSPPFDFGDGGGIFNEDQMTLTGVTVSDNTATGFSGGVGNAGTLTLTDSDVSGNTADLLSGGIGNGGTLTVTNSVIADNTSQFGGGGIGSDGTADVSDSTVSGNTVSDGPAGGIGNDVGGTLTVTNSTISGNTSTGLGGGGIGNAGSAEVTNSTISGNTSVDALGGGIGNNFGGTLTLASSTVSDNTASGGDGIFNGEGSVEVKNSVVANTSSENCSGTVASLGHNLDSDGSCAFAADGDLSDADPLLGPLADNGGPTLTQALLAGSPALDAGSDDCPPPASDQRGVTRPIDGDVHGAAVCDIGAFEFEPPPPPTPTPTATAVPTAVAPAALPPTGGEPASSGGLTPAIALAAVALAVAGAGGALVAVRRRH